MREIYFKEYLPAEQTIIIIIASFADSIQHTSTLLWFYIVVLLTVVTDVQNEIS